MKKTTWNFEIYTNNPKTGESGWDIEFPNIFSETKQGAKDILKNKYPNFDCIILFNYNIPMDELDIKEYANGKNYRIVSDNERLRHD